LKTGSAAEGIPFADYVRSVLDENLDIREELVNLRRIILDQGTRQAHPLPSSGLDSSIDTAAIEALLLLRQLARPENIRAAHADMARLELTPFKSIRS
jgi:hypothetical protein